MKKVAPELDALMWTLAEEGNARAIDEFGARHPNLRGELLHRISMVKGLRDSKTHLATPRVATPKFVPREPHVSMMQARGPAAIVGGLVLAAIAAAAFLVTTIMAPAPRPTVVPIEQTTEKGGSSAVVKTEDKPVEVSPVQSDPTTPGPGSRTIDPPSVNDEKDVADSTKPTNLRIDNAPLFTVLNLMQDLCGVKIQFAPGTLNPMVSVDYHGMTAMDMLRDLGKRYAFTPLDQHDGSIWVVPVVDKSSLSQTNEPSGDLRSRRIGG